MRIIAVIPARAGSKRMPRKNRLELSPGLSLVQHAIDCAVDSGVIEHTVVLSDDTNMRFERAAFMYEPPELANDHADISAAVAHATEISERSLGRIDYVVTLQPAVVARSPLIVQRLVSAVVAARAGGGVTAARTVPWVWTVREDGIATNAWHPGPYPRSQGAHDRLVEINAVQVARRDAVDARQRWGVPLVMAELPSWCAALDIDDPEDLERARDLWPWARSRLETWQPRMHIVDHIEKVPG